MKDNIVELNRHPPTPEGIISRLKRSEGEIDDIVCIIGWKSGMVDIAHSEIKMGELAICARVLQKYVDSEVLSGPGDE